jgi:hypothetical protein
MTGVAQVAGFARAEQPVAEAAATRTSRGWFSSTAKPAKTEAGALEATLPNAVIKFNCSFVLNLRF